MADFKGLLQELTHGNARLETVRSWIDDALDEAECQPDQLLQDLDEAHGAGLPDDITAELRNHITDYTTRDASRNATGTSNLDIDISGLNLEPLDERAKHPAKHDNELLRTLDGADAGPDTPDDTTTTTNKPKNKTPGQPAPADDDATVIADDTATVRRTGPPSEPSEAVTEPRDTSMPTGATGWPTSTSWGKSGGPKHIGPGTVLKERFELVTAIGEGGMGTVYKARDLLKVEAKDRNPYIAVKLLSGDFKEHPESFIALQRESSKAQKLAHPNVATVFDFDRDGSTVFMTMELLEGMELSRYIKRLPPGGLPAAEALDLIKQLCAGLSYAHGRGLVHSDLKPGNAYLINDGTLKLLDFGIARASTTRADASGETTIFDPGQLGALTPAYATVEMFEGEEPDQRDDIYALACICYELLTGKHPYNKLSAVKVKEKGLTPAPVAKLSKRQNRALIKALALSRTERIPTVEELWNELQPRKDYTLVYAGGGIAMFFLLGLVGYAVVLPWLETRQNNEIVASITRQGTESVPGLLESLPQYSESSRRYILDGAREIIIQHYEERAEIAVDPTQGNYDFPGALALTNELKRYYPDSAQVATIERNLLARRNALIAEQTELFGQYLEQDRVLPLENEADITDVAAVFKQADPQNPLLSDARLTTRYADLARQALRSNNYPRADDILKVALNYTPNDAALLNLNDQVQRELQRQAEASQVAELKQRLAEADSALSEPADYAAITNDLLGLLQLRPDDSLLADLLGRLRRMVDTTLTDHIAAGRWSAAEDLLLQFAPLMEIPDLLAKRELLSRAEVRNQYQPESLRQRIGAMEQKRAEVHGLLNAAEFNTAWHAKLDKSFRELIALLRPGTLWLEDLRNTIGQSYLTHAGKMINENRFDTAGQLLDKGRSFAPDLADFVEARARLAAAEEAFRTAEAERVRGARLVALKNQLRVQAEAGEMRNAENTLAQLRQQLPADDEFLNITGPRTIAQAYLGLANAQARENNFSNALTLARRAQDMASDLTGLTDAIAEFSRQAQKAELLRRASTSTPSDIARLPRLLTEVQGMFPQDASSIENELIQALATRIRNLEDRDALLANQILAATRQQFPNQRALADIRLRTPPQPSQYVPEGREALKAGQISKAEQILVTARQNELGHEQVVAFAQELETAKTEANRYFLAYQQNLRGGNRNQARVYLEEAMRRWSDSSLFQSEYQSNFATTRAPTRAADGSRPCTASLATYGASGRAECFDMLSGAKGPVLVVIPAGGGNSVAYAIGKYEVSIGEYNHFCAQTECSRIAGEPGQPVTGIAYSQAQAYVNWLSQTTGKPYRIPAESEWLHAANAANPNAVKDFNCRVTQGGQLLKGVSMLDTRAGRENPWGLVNYVGNAQEWVRSGGSLTARGGHYQNSLTECSIDLGKPHSGVADLLTGFRIARDLD